MNHQLSKVSETFSAGRGFTSRNSDTVGSLRIATQAAVALGLMALLIQSASAQVVAISDGFGDADLNNNGVSFEDVDTSVQGGVGSTTYIPGRLFIDGLSGEPTNNELQPGEEDDPSDVGIRWLQARGFTSAAASNVPGAGNSKPTMRIVDDTQGAMVETQTGTPGALGIEALDTGNAMSWESRGGNSVAIGFFDRNIALGPEVGDEVSVNFDFRMWRDAPNTNSGGDANNAPDFGRLRFGLYQDTNGHIGQTNPFAGRQVDEEGVDLTDPTNTSTPGDLTDSFRPATFGEDEGFFEGSATGQHGAGDEIGTDGASGWSADVMFGNVGTPSGPNGGLTRIREEVNEGRFLQGSTDVDTIVQPENMGGPGIFDPPVYDFINLDIDKAYNIELLLRRATEVEEGDTIFAQLTYTELSTGNVVGVLGGNDNLDPMDNLPGINSDNWDYFGLKNQSSGTGEFDFIFDNFEVVVAGSNESDYLPVGLDGDFNNDGTVNAADYTVWRDNLGLDSAALNGNGTGAATVVNADYDLWKANFGSTSGAGAGSAIPEPCCSVLLVIAAGLLTLKRRSA